MVEPDAGQVVEPDERWHAALDAIGAYRGDRERTFAYLAARHVGPDRHYHTFGHASDVVDRVLSLHDPGDDWATAVMAAWYHDAIYEPGSESGFNEGASAALAVGDLTAMGASLTGIGTVARLICLTANHTTDPADHTGAILCDADLAILGMDAEQYDRYVEAVRAEYGHLDDKTWRHGRRTVLRSYLDRPRIYVTEEGRRRWEAAARTNISRELEQLA